MFALKSHVKSELSTVANKTEIASLNLWKTVNAQQESVNKNVRLLQQNISYLQKALNSKNETIISLLEVQSALKESLNKRTVNEFRIPRSTIEPQQNQPMPTFNLQNQHADQNAHRSFRFRQNLQTTLNIEQDENESVAKEYSRSLRLSKGTMLPQSLFHGYHRKDLSCFCTNETSLLWKFPLANGQL